MFQRFATLKLKYILKGRRSNSLHTNKFEVWGLNCIGVLTNEKVNLPHTLSIRLFRGDL